MKNILKLIWLNVAFIIFIGQTGTAFSQKKFGTQTVKTGSSRMIHRDGTRLVDGFGKPLTLKGVNLGGWLLWEGWIWGGGFNSQTQIMNRLTQVVGASEANRFQTEVYENFITEADFKEIARLGFNVVRIPVNHSVLEDDEQPYIYKESGWKILDRVLQWAEKYKVYVVFDLHAAPGGQNGGFISDPQTGNSLWKSAENKPRAAAWWRAVADRYKNREIIAGYDLLNEPTPPDGRALVEFYRDAIRAIREVDQKHLVILEGGDYARDFSMFTERLDENQAYGFHIYTWFRGQKERDRVASIYAAIAQKHNVPVWNGEFGEDQTKEISRQINLFDDNETVSGWAFWTWKKVPNHSPALTGITPPEKWKKLMNWVSIPFLNRKPSKTEAQSAMREFITAIRFENNTQNQQVIDILK